MSRAFTPQGVVDRLGLRIRWVLLAAAAGLGYLHWIELWFVLGCLGFAAVGIVGFLLTRGQGQRRLGQVVLASARFFDVGAFAALSFFGPLSGENLWLLAVPVVLVEGLASGSAKRVAALALVGAVPALASLALTGLSVIAICAVCTMAGSAMASVVLATYRERERVLAARDERLKTVLNCAEALAAATDLRSMITLVLKAAVDELDANRGYVMLTGEEGSASLKTEAAYSVDGTFDFPDTLDVGSGVTGYAVKMGQPISIRDRDNEQMNLEGVGRGAVSIVSVPLIARNYMGPAQASTELVLGAVTLLGNSETSFTSPDDMQLLRSLASLVAEAVANARMEERQRTTFLKTLETLAGSLEARDVYTRGHSQRVSEVSMMIGERMGLAPDAIEELRVGTILHDIGKIGVPDSILNKPGRLTDEEFTVMKSHPVIGYRICQPLGLSEGVLMIIRNHHEKLDGSGYPDGLKGGELPLSLRIVCVADAFDAMSSRRPYRDVMDMSRVLAELSAGAGVQFDPVVVETLKELLHTEGMRTCYASQWLAGQEQAA